MERLPRHAPGFLVVLRNSADFAVHGGFRSIRDRSGVSEGTSHFWAVFWGRPAGCEAFSGSESIKKHPPSPLARIWTPARRFGEAQFVLSEWKLNSSFFCWVQDVIGGLVVVCNFVSLTCLGVSSWFLSSRTVMATVGGRKMT